MSELNLSVSALSLYNPTRMSDADLVASFVVRQDVFERVLGDIVAEKPNSRPQHHLIVGQRGMGKSTLLARLATELRRNTTSDQSFVPLVFAEEQYAVDRLSKFWLNCLDSLADACEREGNDEAANRIDEVVQRLNDEMSVSARDDERHAKNSLEAFLQQTEQLQRRSVLLVDNLQIVFERLTSQQQHSLRELLMRPSAPVLVGTSPTPPADSQDYGAAFYDHFKVHYLRSLSVDEMRELMIGLAERANRPEVTRRVVNHPNRLSALRQLTGGNPRTTVTQFFLYAEDFSPSVFGDLENLLDRMTPLYKARFEELSAQQQVVAGAIASHWDPITARELADAIGLKPTGVMPQIDRLEKIGFVERVSLYDKKSAGFQIAERFFNIWYLMRSSSRRQRREVEFLTRFIEAFYEPADRSQIASQLRTEQNFSADRQLFTLALARTIAPPDARDLKRHAELDAIRQKEREARRRLEEVIDFSALPAPVQTFSELHDRLAALVPNGAGVAPDEFAQQVLGDRKMFESGERIQLAGQKSLTKDEVERITEGIAASWSNDWVEYGEVAANWITERLASGQLADANDPGDWIAAFQQAPESECVRLLLETIPVDICSELPDETVSGVRKTLQPSEQSEAWKWLLWSYHLSKLSLISDAELAIRQAVSMEDSAMPWFLLGVFLTSETDSYEEAEDAYRNSLDRQETADVWESLGNLLQDHLGRVEEAESAYRRAIKLRPTFARPWNGLGNVQQNHLEDYQGAEESYRRAIELDDQFTYPWNGLGNLYQDHLNRFEESEECYRSAIAIDHRFAGAWNGLGNLLQNHLGRYDEAEGAFCQALTIDDSVAHVWNNLGFLLHIHLQRPKEAESAFRRAIELNNNDALAWRNLAFLLQGEFGRQSEAESAFQRSIEIDSRPESWNGLGNNYCDNLHRFADAERAYAEALKLDPKFEFAVLNNIFLQRDFLGRGSEVHHLFEDYLAEFPVSTAPDAVALHEALFAAYDENWGLVTEALARAIKLSIDGFPKITLDDWQRGAAVLIHLNFGGALLEYLRNSGERTRLRPWYEAIGAVEAGSEEPLKNLAPEIRTIAVSYYREIKRRLDGLPQNTCRRVVSKKKAVRRN